MTLALLTRCAATLPLLGSNQDSSDPEAVAGKNVCPTDNRHRTLDARNIEPCELSELSDADAARWVAAEYFHVRSHGQTVYTCNGKPDRLAFRLDVAKRPTTNVYVVRRPDTGALKIGHSRNFVSRIGALQVDNDVALELVLHFPALRWHEDRLHKEFAAHRKFGEWFHPAPAVLEWLANQSRVPGVVVP